MGVVGLFARRDHPEGYGMGGKAHGYVVLAVRCADLAQLAEAKAALHAGWRGIPGEHLYERGHLGDWYGGVFDLVGVVSHPLAVETISGPDYGEPTLTTTPDARFRSYGDNRFFGVYTAEEVLGR